MCALGSILDAARWWYEALDPEKMLAEFNKPDRNSPSIVRPEPARKQTDLARDIRAAAISQVGDNLA